MGRHSHCWSVAAVLAAGWKMQWRPALHAAYSLSDCSKTMSGTAWPAWPAELSGSSCNFFRLSMPVQFNVDQHTRQSANLCTISTACTVLYACACQTLKHAVVIRSKQKVTTKVKKVWWIVIRHVIKVIGDDIKKSNDDKKVKTRKNEKSV